MRNNLIGRRWLSISLAILVTILAGVAQAAESRSLATILKAGELRIGISLYTPWALRAETGELIGSEIDIGRRLADDMGVKPEFREYSWQDLISALNRGEIDIIIAGLSVTPERALKVAFSRPYRSTGIGLATNIKLTKQFNSLTDLNQPGVAVAVIDDTQSAEVAKRLFGDAAIKSFKAESQVEKALVDGMVHAFVRAEPVPRYLALRHPKVIDVPLDKPLLTSREAFAVRKGDPDFVNFLDAWIIAREDDAWLTSTRKYWFESLGWQQQVKP